MNGQELKASLDLLSTDKQDELAQKQDYFDEWHPITIEFLGTSQYDLGKWPV